MQIAIIGAGISGLSCARILHDHGHAVHVFEKSRGPSGRASTRKTDHWQADHGAQYFTARSPAFQQAVNGWIDLGIASTWTGRIMAAENGRLSPSESVVRYVGTPTIPSIARHLAQGLHLQLQTTITEIRRANDAWQLHSQEHGWHEDAFDLVVFSIPAPQLQPFVRHFSADVIDVIEAVVFDPCLAIMMQYPHPLDLGFDGLFANDAVVGWVSRNNSKPGRSGLESWVIHMTPGFSQTHWESAAEFIQKAADQFMQGHGAPACEQMTLHRWRYALSHRGGDSNRGVHHDSLVDAQHRLAFCGDWLSGGRIEGAWQSGQHAAQQILRVVAGR